MNSFFTEDLVFFYSTIKVMKVSYRKEQLFVVVVACFKKKKKFKESIDHVSTQLMKDAVQFSIGTLLFAQISYSERGYMLHALVVLLRQCNQLKFAYVIFLTKVGFNMECLACLQFLGTKPNLLEMQSTFVWKTIVILSLLKVFVLFAFT